MLLSILIPGKNDNFRDNTKKVLEFNINKTINNINKLGCTNIELVICDWGSEPSILDDIITESSPYIRYIYVSPDICKKYNGKANYSIVHPINTAFRQSIGEYVIFWDSDAYIDFASFKNLYNFVLNMKQNNDMKFYWGSRHHVPFYDYMQFDHYSQFDNYLLTHNNYPKDILQNADNFGGCSISLLMNRILWESSTGWWEKLIYWGWQDIEFHFRLRQKYEYGGDLEDFNIRFMHFLWHKQEYKSLHNQNGIYPTDNNGNKKFKAHDGSWGLSDENLNIQIGITK